MGAVISRAPLLNLHIVPGIQTHFLSLRVCSHDLLVIYSQCKVWGCRDMLGTG